MEYKNFLNGATNYMQGKLDSSQKRFKTELHGRSDEEVKNVIRNGNSLARKAAMEEADRRGISY